MVSSFGRIAALRAAIFVTASTYVSYGISIIVGAIVARSLGPTGYGEYAYVVWLTGLLVILANNGITTSGIRFVSECLGRQRADLAGHVHAWLSKRQTVALLLVLALFIGWAVWLPTPQWHIPLLQFMAVITICVIAKTRYIFDVSIAKGYGNFGIDPLTTTVSAVGSGVVSVVLASMHAPVIAFILLFVVTSLGISACGAWLTRRAGVLALPGQIDPELRGQVRQHLFWTAVLAVSVGLGTRSIETYLLADKFGPEAVAFYTVAGNLMRGSADLLTVGLGAVLLPAMSRAHGAGGIERVRPIFSDSLRYLTFLGLLLAGAGALCAEPVVRIMYGARYLPAVPVLQAMMICMGITLSEATTGTLLTTTGRQRARASIVLGNLITAATLAILLVPRYGLMGATASYVISRVAYSLVVGVHSLRATGTPLPADRLLRLLASAGVAAAAALGLLQVWSDSIAWLLASVLYAVLFVVVSVLIRAWTPHDVDVALAFSAKLPGARIWANPLLVFWRQRFTH
jgi:O-antigen/teichoic acid export membrane protein